MCCPKRKAETSLTKSELGPPKQGARHPRCITRRCRQPCCECETKKRGVGSGHVGLGGWKEGCRSEALTKHAKTTPPKEPPKRSHGEPRSRETTQNTSDAVACRWDPEKQTCGRGERRRVELGGRRGGCACVVESERAGVWDCVCVHRWPGPYTGCVVNVRFLGALMQLWVGRRYFVDMSTRKGRVVKAHTACECDNSHQLYANTVCTPRAPHTHP
jgi:hypothetical protein